MEGPTRVPIPVGERFDPTVFDPSRPVVFRKAASSWPAVQTWTPEQFANRYGEMVIEPSVGLPDTEVPYQFRDGDYRQKMTIAKFVELMRSGDR
ncbi:MAG: hypothetical protein ABI837_02600, partial [Acidobacteriota bacterium]